MPLQSVAGRDKRVVKVIRRFSRHPKLGHHGTRTRVAWHGQGDDFGQVEGLETELQGRLSCLGREALAPVLAREPPAYLDARRKGGRIARDAKTDHSDEARNAWRFDRPEAKAFTKEVLGDASNECVALRPRERTQQVPRYLVVGVQFREERQVFIAPGPEAQPGCLQFLYHGVIRKWEEGGYIRLWPTVASRRRALVVDVMPIPREFFMADVNWRGMRNFRLGRL